MQHMETAGIIDARFAGQRCAASVGLAVLTGDFRFYWCQLVDGVVKCKAYADFGTVSRSSSR